MLCTSRSCIRRHPETSTRRWTCSSDWWNLLQPRTASENVELKSGVKVTHSWRTIFALVGIRTSIPGLQSGPLTPLHTLRLNYTCLNLQATKLFIVTSATKGGWLPPPRFSVRFKILYRVIQPLIQHCLLHKMVYLNIILCYCCSKLWIFYYRQFSVINELLRYSTVSTYVLAK